MISVIAISGCTGQNQVKVVPYDPNALPGANEVEDTSPVYFSVDDAIDYALVRQPYNYSFCNPPVSSPSNICRASGDPNEEDIYYDKISLRGGNPPYHFVLESGKGFPPMGLNLHPNGFLDGTPTAAGTSAFSVCAVDQSGRQACQNTTLEVKDVDLTFDSVVCRKVSKEGFVITAKGTAKGPKDAHTEYVPNIDAVNKQFPDALVYIDAARNEPSNCGNWEATPMVIPWCINKGDTSTTSWTFVYWLHTSRRPITMKPIVSLVIYDRFLYRQIDVSKEVTCG